MDTKSVLSEMMYRGVDLESVSRDTDIDDHWQVNDVVSQVRTSRLTGAVIGLMANMGLGAAAVVVGMMAGVDPDQAELIMGTAFVAGLPVSFPLAFTWLQQLMKREHRFSTMNKMGIFRQQDRDLFMKTLKAMPAGKEIYIKANPNHHGDVGVWKMTATSLSFHGVKPGDGGWDDALEQVISCYQLDTIRKNVWKDDLPYRYDLKEKDYLYSMAFEYEGY